MVKKKLEEKKYEEKYSLNEDFRINQEIKTGEVAEKRDKITTEEVKDLRERIDNTDLSESLLPQVEKHAQKVRSLKDDQKIKKLLEITDKKGVIYAIGVAKRMNDSFILDTFHDALVEKGYYKIFINKN